MREPLAIRVLLFPNRRRLGAGAADDGQGGGGGVVGGGHQVEKDLLLKWRLLR